LQRRQERALREPLEISEPTELRLIPRVPSFPSIVKLGQTVQLVPNCNSFTWPKNAPYPLAFNERIRNRTERPQPDILGNSGEKSAYDGDNETNNLLRVKTITDTNFFSSDI
jgi:hypothetical protein